MQKCTYITVVFNEEGNEINVGPGENHVLKMDDGFSYRTAEFKFADGSEHIGLVAICDQDSGEHYETAIFIPGEDEPDIAWQGDSGFLEKLGKNAAEVYPYRYRYHGWVTTRNNDCHIGNDGWSHSHD